MMWPDAVNGSFELLAGIACGLHVRALWLSKRVQGVSITSFAFFAAWGYWNMFYYPQLGQWLSFYGGFAIVTMNTVWLVLAVTYTRRRRKMFSHLNQRLLK